MRHTINHKKCTNNAFSSYSLIDTLSVLFLPLFINISSMAFLSFSHSAVDKFVILVLTLLMVLHTILNNNFFLIIIIITNLYLRISKPTPFTRINTN